MKDVIDQCSARRDVSSGTPETTEWKKELSYFMEAGNLPLLERAQVPGHMLLGKTDAEVGVLRLLVGLAKLDLGEYPYVEFSRSVPMSARY